MVIVANLSESSWIEQLISVGDELGGVELDIPDDEPATVASF